MLDAAMPPDTGPVLFANVTLLSNALLLWKESGACRSVRCKFVNEEFTIVRLSCHTVMSAEKGRAVLLTLLMWSELSIVAFTPVAQSQGQVMVVLVPTSCSSNTVPVNSDTNGPSTGATVKATASGPKQCTDAFILEGPSDP